MKTSFKTVGDTVYVNVEGKLNYEAQEPLKDDLSRYVAQSDTIPKKFIFNLKELEFVGSSGISTFVRTLKEFNTTVSTRPRYCHVRSEFKKIIQAFDEDNAFDFYDTEENAKKSFDN